VRAPSEVASGVVSRAIRCVDRRPARGATRRGHPVGGCCCVGEECDVGEVDQGVEPAGVHAPPVRQAAPVAGQRVEAGARGRVGVGAAVRTGARARQCADAVEDQGEVEGRTGGEQLRHPVLEGEQPHPALAGGSASATAHGVGVGVDALDQVADAGPQLRAGHPRQVGLQGRVDLPGLRGLERRGPLDDDAGAEVVDGPDLQRCHRHGQVGAQRHGAGPPELVHQLGDPPQRLRPLRGASGLAVAQALEQAAGRPAGDGQVVRLPGIAPARPVMGEGWSVASGSRTLATSPPRLERLPEHVRRQRDAPTTAHDAPRLWTTRRSHRAPVPELTSRDPSGWSPRVRA